MEAVLPAFLKRDPTFTLFLWDLWTRVPALMWLTVLGLDIYAVYLASRIH